MTLTTTEVVTVDGVDLNTLAYNLETLTGRNGIPGRRGDNGKRAYRNGTKWRRKRYEEKTETWAMWVRGCDPDGTVPVTGDRAEYNKNVYMLKQLFGKNWAELNLQKKVLLPSGLLTLTAKGECVSTMEPTIVGNRAVLARFTADILMADPLWYGATTTLTVAGAGATVVNPGTALTDKMVITITGGATAVLTNTTLGISLTVAGPVSSPIVLDTDAFTAMVGATNAVSRVSHTGSVPWMELAPGNNVFTLTGGGSVSISVKPAYL